MSYDKRCSEKFRKIRKVCNFIKKDSGTGIFKSTLFTEHIQVAASVMCH